MPIWQQWSVNPDENNKAAPNGAPQNGFYFDGISKTFRNTMAGIAEVGQLLVALASSLGSAAFLSASEFAANMTSGFIQGAVDIDATAIKRGFIDLARIPANLTGKLADGLTVAFKQTLYNWIYPVGRIMLWHHTDLVASGVVWPGVTATWSIIEGSGDRIIVTAGALVDASNGGGTMPYASTSFGTYGAGAHNHGGATADHVLTENEMPPHQHTMFGTQGSGGTEGSGGLGGSNEQTGVTGGGQAHSHGISTVDDHAHAFPYDPARYGVVVIVRTA